MGGGGRAPAGEGVYQNLARLFLYCIICFRHFRYVMCAEAWPREFRKKDFLTKKSHFFEHPGRRKFGEKISCYPLEKTLKQQPAFFNEGPSPFCTPKHRKYVRPFRFSERYKYFISILHI